MIVVIQCAAKKQPDAGYLRTSKGKPVLFVADPDIAPQTDQYFYAGPDDISDKGETWRDILLHYNRNPADNPLGLLKAYELYKNPTYHQLAEWNGINNTYILSAGWGLIKASFLIPMYDITFKYMPKKEERFKQRGKKDIYNDLLALPEHTDEPIVFLGGKDYIPMFCSLTSAIMADKMVVYNSDVQPNTPGCSSVRYQTRTRTNWHYECAKALINDDFKI